MRFQFETPLGWEKATYPPPGRGIFLRYRSLHVVERGAIFFQDALTKDGTLAEQLDRVVTQIGQDGEIIKKGEHLPIRSRVFPGVMCGLRLRLRDHQELRIAILLETETMRLPILFIGGSQSFPKHQAALDKVVYSVSSVDGGPGNIWAE